MTSVGFEPTISAGERPQTYALDRAATGTGITPTIANIIGIKLYYNCFFLFFFNFILTCFGALAPSSGSL